VSGEDIAESKEADQVTIAAMTLQVAVHWQH
jgi:hypothetical protein